jgi:glycosyltransferase involved in cell wall biosynthesis
VTGALRLSVVVPVHNGAPALARCLAALEASDLPRSSWELLVVDDASTDECATVATNHADRILRIEQGPCGPALARNRGAGAARAEVIAFVDADVIVHPDALRRMVEALDADASVAAVFGAYDESLSAPGFLSQYRNLLHRYVHLAGAGETDTFWAGCGAVRRAAFLDAGGFDEGTFRRPQIEDIDLGYRLRDRGWRILLQPDIQAGHLKRWTLPGMIRTDVMDRGIPWMRLLLERGAMGGQRSHVGRSGTLNIRWQEKVKTGLVALALVLAVAGAATGLAAWVWAGLIAFTALLLSNLPLYGWFARRRGVVFAVGVVPLSVLYYALNAGCAATAYALHVKDRLAWQGGAR